MHGAGRTRQYRVMERASEKPRHVAARDAGGCGWRASIPQSASPPSTPSRAAVASISESHRSHLSRQIPLIPLNPTEFRLSRRIPPGPAASRLSRRIPLVPAASGLSRRIPLGPVASHLSRQSLVNPIPRDAQDAIRTTTEARDAVVSHSRSFYPSTRRPHHVMAALDAAIHVFAQGSVGPAERDARIKSGRCSTPTSRAASARARSIRWRRPTSCRARSTACVSLSGTTPR